MYEMKKKHVGILTSGRERKKKKKKRRDVSIKVSKVQIG